MRRQILAGAAVVLGMASAGRAQESPRLPGSPAVRFQLSFADARHHYVDVQAHFPTAGQSSLELFMPVWTPGSYMIREYARSVEGFQATANGKPVAVERTRKNRWRMSTAGAAQVDVSYRVYGRELSVRNNFVDSDFAILTPAATFVTEVGKEKRPYQIHVVLPPDWKDSLTGLVGTRPDYQAEDFDELIDSPFLLGNPTVSRVQVQGVEHVLVDQGGGSVWDSARAAADLKVMMEQAYQLWGFFPYAQEGPRNYHFFNILLGPGGGLEHHNSTVLMSNRWVQRLHKDYLGWLALVAHENFHAWNVKRLRPVALRPFDYENENYTPSLWVAEGFTAYYDDLLVRRAGFSTHKEYLEALSKAIDSQQQAPGRLVQSLAHSSYEAWVKFYRPDENSVNTSISYYTKGSLVALLLDQRIRAATQNRKSLDDVMRTAYRRYSGEHGYSDAEFRKVAEEVAGQPLGDFFRQSVDELGELDFEGALKYYGLRWKGESKKEGVDPSPGWLGATTDNLGGRLVVRSVRRGTPAYEAGLNADDEIVAVDDFRMLPDKWEDRLKQFPAGSRVTLTISRREQLRRLPVTLGKKPTEWALEVDPAATPEARANLTAWLGADKK